MERVSRKYLDCIIELCGGETPAILAAREYREFQKDWIKGSCAEYKPYPHNLGIKCRCNKPWVRHHEARYAVSVMPSHAGLL